MIDILFTLKAWVSEKVLTTRLRKVVAAIVLIGSPLLAGMGHVSSLLGITQSFDKSAEEVGNNLNTKNEERYQKLHIQNNEIKEQLKKLVEQNNPNFSQEEKDKIIQELEQKVKSLETDLASLKDIDEKKRTQAMSALKDGDFAKAEKLLEELRLQARENIAKRKKEYAKLAKVQGDAAYLQFHLQRAYDLYLEAAENDPSNWSYHNLCGRTAMDLGHLDKAIEQYSAGLDVLTHDTPNTAGNVALLNNLGLAWTQKGDLDKSIEYFNRALAIDEHLFGKMHQDVARDLHNIGFALFFKGDPDKAIDFYNRALAIDVKAFGRDHPDVAAILNNLGAAWIDKGDLDKAIDFASQSLVIDEKIFGMEHPNIASNLNTLGLAWKAKGDLNKAIDFYNRALTIDERTFGKEHPKIAIRLTNLGAAWFYKGDLNKAIDFYNRALTIDEKTYGKKHPLLLGNSTTLVRFGRPKETWTRPSKTSPKPMPSLSPHSAQTTRTQNSTPPTSPPPSPPATRPSPPNNPPALLWALVQTGCSALSA